MCPGQPELSIGCPALADLFKLLSARGGVQWLHIRSDGWGCFSQPGLLLLLTLAAGEFLSELDHLINCVTVGG